MNELNPTQSQCWCGKRECCCVHSTSVKINQQGKTKKGHDWDLGPGSSPCKPAPASSLHGESESDRHSTGQLYWVSRLCSIPHPAPVGGAHVRLSQSFENPALMIRTLQDRQLFLCKLHTESNENLFTRIPFKYFHLLNFRSFNLLPLFLNIKVFFLIIKVKESKN